MFLSNTTLFDGRGIYSIYVWPETLILASWDYGLCTTACILADLAGLKASFSLWFS